MHSAPAAVAALAIWVCCSSGLAQQAFLDKLSAAPGETVRVHVSSGSNYDISVWRSHYFTENERLLRVGQFEADVQGTVRGSFAEVATNPGLEITGNLTLEAWVRPVLSGDGNFYGILSKYSLPSHTAYMIYLMPSGQLSFYLGATGVFSTTNRTLSSNAIPTNQFTHVVATYDGQNKRIYINGRLDVTAPRTGPIFNTNQPVRVGAYGSSGVAAEVFNGQIDSPTIYNRVLSAADVERRFAERADYEPGLPSTMVGAVAQWNFSELEGTTLADATGNGNDLTLVNYGARGVSGPSPRLGPHESHSIRFSEEDLVNPSWSSSFGFIVPSSWESGFYYVEIGSIKLPLIIKPRPGAERRIAVLAATNTWHAYNSWSGNSLYSTHRGGPIAYYVGMRQPNPGAHINLHTPGGGYSHLVDAERYLYKWLDDNDYPFDLYSDLDLHRGPGLLDSYDVLFLNGHSEYWSTEMVDHVEMFQARGGSVVNLSGNTMWSRVTYDPAFTIMEGRKHPHSAGTIPPSELWHSQAGGVRAGTLRCIGRPEHEVIGTGYGIIVGAPNFGSAKVLMPTHWAFAGTGLSEGSLFGENSPNGGGIMGHESDVVLPQWTPANTQILARGVYPAGGASTLNISNCQSRSSAGVTEGGDVIYFDHPGGGAVFGIPSVAAGSALVVDPVATRILRNVLDRFLAPNAACAFRNGTGVNPAGFNCVTDPTLGTSWQTTIVVTGSTLATFVGIAASPGQFPFGGGELLIGVVPPPVLVPGVGTHSVAIPTEPTLLGASLATQGFRLDMAGRTTALTMLNAQDLTLGL